MDDDTMDSAGECRPCCRSRHQLHKNKKYERNVHSCERGDGTVSKRLGRVRDRRRNERKRTGRKEIHPSIRLLLKRYGADDWELAKQVNLPFVQHVNLDGTMKPEVKDFAGMEVKPRSDDDKVRLGTDIAVLKYLQEHGTFFSKENIVHSYPHCWRCDTPLLNYATSSWFVRITKIKDGLLKNAEAVNWSPAHIKEGRFGKWLEGARDWSISRQRFWASDIPIWVCEACKKQRVFGSA